MTERRTVTIHVDDGDLRRCEVPVTYQLLHSVLGLPDDSLIVASADNPIRRYLRLQVVGMGEWAFDGTDPKQVSHFARDPRIDMVEQLTEALGLPQVVRPGSPPVWSELLDNVRELRQLVDER